MTARLLKYAAWPLCLLLLAGAVFGNSSSILCVGHDGEVKVEVFTRSEDDGDHHHPHSDCHECSDFLLSDLNWSFRPSIGDPVNTGSTSCGMMAATPDWLSDLSIQGTGLRAFFDPGRSRAPAHPCLLPTVLRC